MLAWHVDYWDRLGWPDPFASKDHTERQRAYVPHLGTKGLVTPQILVGNRPQEAGWQEFVRAESARPPAVQVTAALKVDAGRLRYTVRLARPAADFPAGAVVRPVLFQYEASTEVPRGENAGKTLVEHFVVRATGATIPAATALGKGVEGSLPLPAGVDPVGLGLVLLVEEPSAMRTLEAAVFDLPTRLRPLLVIRERDPDRGEAARKALAGEAEKAGFALAVFAGEDADLEVFDRWLSGQRRAVSADRTRVVALGVGEGVDDLWNLERRVSGRLRGAVSVHSLAPPIPSATGEAVADHRFLFVVGRGAGEGFLEEVEAIRSSLSGGGVESDLEKTFGREPLEVLAKGARDILAWAKKRMN